jgi:hypothetical protein
MGYGVLCVIFPLREAMSGPKILLDALTSAGVIGQSIIMFERTMLVKSFDDGYPTSPRPHRAALAQSYWRWV